MARVTLVWESGCGWGHVVPLRQLAGELIGRGHEVVHVSRELERSYAVFSDLDVELHQAPLLVHEIPGHVPEPATHAHILHNDGFGDPHALGGLAGAWRALFELLEPDLLVMDLCTVALLAARAAPCPRVVFGTGFAYPPDPLPDVRPDLGRSPESLTRDEATVLGAANAWLDRHRLGPLGRLSDLWRDVDDAIVTTIPELDHFGPRELDYVGILAGHGVGSHPAPDPAACEVFVYVKPFPALPLLLQTMEEAGVRALVVGDLMDSGIADRFRSGRLTFPERLVDVGAAARACRFAVLNGTHGTTGAMLLAGKPVLSIPIQREQLMTGRAVERAGAGLVAAPADAEGVAHAFWRMNTEPGFARAAREVAARHEKDTPALVAARAADRVEAALRSG